MKPDVLPCTGCSTCPSNSVVVVGAAEAVAVGVGVAEEEACGCSVFVIGVKDTMRSLAVDLDKTGL